MSTIKETFIISLTYEMSVDTETGEVLETRLIDRSINKPVKSIKIIANEAIQYDDKEPKLYLEDNKCKLNPSAISLLGINIGDKLDIKYEDCNGKSIPLIGTDEAFGTKGGTKVTKSGTFSYRGSKNDLLSKYGKEFTITKHLTKDRIFILNSDNKPKQLKGDENITTDEVDLNLEDLLNDEEDTKIQSINSNFFKL